MLSRDSGSHHLRPPATLGGVFTRGELERLATLRREYSGHAEHSELMIDPLQLEFMRWLFEHGRLSESLPKPGAHARAEELTPD